MVSPTLVSCSPGLPPSRSPPPTRVGSSAASTTASTPRRLASLTIASPALRPRTTAVATSTPWYSSPTAFARLSAARARLSSSSGTRVSSGSAIGTSKTQTASITAPPSPSSSPSSAASRPAVCMMSSSSGVPSTGTRIEPNSASAARRVSAASGTVTRLNTGLPCDVR